MAKAIYCYWGLVVTLFIMVIPYVIYIHQETGRWLISKKAVEHQSGLFDKGMEEDDPSLGIERNKPVRTNTQTPGVIRNVIQFLPSVIYHYLRAFHFSLWLFLFFGLIRVRRKGVGHEWFVASLILFHLRSLSTFVPSAIRFSIPRIPLSIFWAGANILETKRYLQKLKGAYAEKVVFIFVALVMLSQLPQILKPERGHRASQKKVGLWLRQNTPADAIIMSNSPQETFYADREFMVLPRGFLPLWN